MDPAGLTELLADLVSINSVNPAYDPASPGRRGDRPLRRRLAAAAGHRGLDQVEAAARMYAAIMLDDGEET